jgi:transketolase
MNIRKRSKKLVNRRSISVMAIIIAISAISGYCYWSIQTWGGYEKSYSGLRQEIRQSTDDSLALAANSYDERSRKITSLIEVANDIKAKESICDIPGYIGWQAQLFADPKSKIAKCNEVVDSIANYSTDLRSVVSYLEVEQKIANIINSTVSSQKQTEKTWDSQLAAWTKAVGDIDSIQSETSSQPVKENALNYAKKMEVSWKAVIAAHKAHNKAGYLGAYAELVRSHEMLTNIASDSQSTFNVLAKELQSSYDTLK